jgi:putative hydrolase of the HAD superfamily
MTRLPDWAAISTVLLDMDGTLLDLKYDNYFWLHHLPLRYAAQHDLPEDEARSYLHDRFTSERGTMNWYCLDYWSDELAIDVALLKAEVAHLIGIHPHVLAFLDALRASGREAVLVTNAHQKSLALKLKHTELGGHLDQVICSHDLGLPKEDPSFWDKLRQRLVYDKSTTLLIDDNLDVLRSAQRGGIAFLLAMARPDSQKPPQATAEFNAIEHFTELMPGLT